jgi:hypothetical protein
MISSFSEPGSLIPRLPHPRSCFFLQPQFQRHSRAALLVHLCRGQPPANSTSIRRPSRQGRPFWFGAPPSAMAAKRRLAIGRHSGKQHERMNRWVLESCHAPCHTVPRCTAGVTSACSSLPLGRAGQATPDFHGKAVLLLAAGPERMALSVSLGLLAAAIPTCAACMRRPREIGLRNTPQREINVEIGLRRCFSATDL